MIGHDNIIHMVDMFNIFEIFFLPLSIDQINLVYFNVGLRKVDQKWKLHDPNGLFDM